jgi:hypothetical protein
MGQERRRFRLPLRRPAESESKVLLIDAHPQHTATDWSAVREKPPPFMLIGLPQPVLHRGVPPLAADYDYVVIDGPPRNYEVTRSAIAAADLVLIPVQPSGADFWASRERVKLSEEHTHTRAWPAGTWLILDPAAPALGSGSAPHDYFAKSRAFGPVLLCRHRNQPRWATARAAT